MCMLIVSGIFSANYDGVVKSLHLLRYRVWSDVRHTTCMPSRLAKYYALYMKIST
jgi:hypothetical protein